VSWCWRLPDQNMPHNSGERFVSSGLWIRC
jgi:hypothetical protein